MQRVRTLLIKLTDLAQRNSERTAIDVDLMLDYTRVLYADLLEIRNSMGQRHSAPSIDEPTLDELTAAMERGQQPSAHQEAKLQAPAFAREATSAPESVAAPVPAPPVPAKAASDRGDIRAYIDLNDKYLFLSEFFGNDLRAYEQAMVQLNALSTEDEALLYLGHRLDGNDAGIAFKNVINRFYAN